VTATDAGCANSRTGNLRRSQAGEGSRHPEADALWLGGQTRCRVCPIRVPFSQVFGTLITRRQLGTRRPGIAAGSGRGRLCACKGTFLRTSYVSTRRSILGHAVEVTSGRSVSHSARHRYARIPDSNARWSGRAPAASVGEGGFYGSVIPDPSHTISIIGLSQPQIKTAAVNTGLSRPWTSAWKRPLCPCLFKHSISPLPQRIEQSFCRGGRL
jgi:hypothetical protein